jgi:hypothetical protein
MTNVIAIIEINTTKIHWDNEFLGIQRNIEMQDDIDKKIKKDQYPEFLNKLMYCLPFLS